MLVINDDGTVARTVHDNKIVIFRRTLDLASLGRCSPFDTRFFDAAARSFSLPRDRRRRYMPIRVFVVFLRIEGALSWDI